MEKVTIKFAGGGPMEVKDEKGKVLPTNRVALYLLPGSDYPVAEFESHGEFHSALVASLEVVGLKGAKA